MENKRNFKGRIDVMLKGTSDKGRFTICEAPTLSQIVFEGIPAQELRTCEGIANRFCEDNPSYTWRYAG